jgi:hypothetical protein
MALNSDNIYVGQAKMYFAVLDRDFDLFDRKPTITLNDIGSFKASNESTFFGAYSSNAAVKASAYNQLKVNSFTILNKLRTNGTMAQNIKTYFYQLNPTIVSAIINRRDTVQTLKTTRWLNQTSSYFKQLYHFQTNAKIYLPAKFDTVTLKAQFDYRNNISNNGAIYPYGITFDYIP